MPIICIGPVCIPITAIIPLLLFIFKPIYVRLPKAYQKKIDYGIKECQLALNRCLKKIGWTKSKKKSSKTETSNNTNNNGDKSTNYNKLQNGKIKNGKVATKKSVDSTDKGLIPEMENDDEWDQLMEESVSNNLLFIAYFTSPWCEPCKKFYPTFEKLATDSHDKMKFIKVDIDEFDEIALEYKVSKLPTFILFKNGEPNGSVTGPNKEELEHLFKL